MVLTQNTRDESVDPEAEQLHLHITRCRSELFAALERGSRAVAREWMEVAAEWHDLRSRVGRKRECLSYVLDDQFARDLVKLLSPVPDEKICFVSGMRLGIYRTFSRTHSLAPEENSPIYVRSTGASARDALISLSDAGYSLTAVAHSHPGESIRATSPSGIDDRYMSRIQQSGCEAIGIIIVKSGYIRVFSPQRPFEVICYGNRIKQLDPDLFQVRLTDA